jgi:(1->4)-alpha-D-glucan 1-alpha-D-glucosylmutase
MTTRFPASTYRLQLNRDFTLHDAAELVDYLDELGVGACYTSPLLQARAGSPHGYDIVNHAAVNPELGGLRALRRLTRRLAGRGMGLVFDVVPNHMCIADLDNRWWVDVLENGPSSPYAHYFDIDWNPPKAELVGKVLLPILGEQYGRVLESQQISVHYEAGAFWVRYDALKLPLEPRSYVTVLAPALASLASRLGESDERVLELASAITALHNLPSHLDTAPTHVAERRREKEIVKRRLAGLGANSHEVHQAINESLDRLNGQLGDPRSFDALEALLACQAFRLSFWRVAADEINYRRFFDINELAAIRVDEPAVFWAVHELWFRLLQLEPGLLTGLRIDHVDGIADPLRYLERVADKVRRARPPPPAADSGSAYIVVEKILVGGEELRSEWPVAGTTGYEFLNLVNGLFVDASNQAAMLGLYTRFTGVTSSFDDVLYESKQLVLTATMAGELHVLARRLERIAAQHRGSRDFTFNSLQQALGEIIACFPVYRTYLGQRAGLGTVPASREDQGIIALAVRRARRRNPLTSATLFDFIAGVLLMQTPSGLLPTQRAERREFVLRFQQLTAPVMAKGMEDTAFYRYCPLGSLNEVGGSPQHFGVSIAEFHRQCCARLARWPGGLSATATHDTKRGEDVRARLNVLSEIPQQWEAALACFHDLGEPARRKLSDLEIPSRQDEYLLYQTLIGTWPFDDRDATHAEQDGAGEGEYAERIKGYMIKAVKEAKVHTSWISPDEEYEQALRDFIAAILAPGPDNRFVRALAEFCRPIQVAGIWNSLAQVLLKITAPGVPDFFQGTELWDLSLVDPDNRRPVDFAHRRRLLAALHAPETDASTLCARLCQAPRDGRLKLYVTSRALQWRRAHAALFHYGTYEPLLAVGARRDDVIAYARRLPPHQAVVVAARFHTRAGAAQPVGEQRWQDTTLPLPAPPIPAIYRDVFTGAALAAPPDGALAVRQVLAQLPVALLVGEADFQPAGSG